MNRRRSARVGRPGRKAPAQPRAWRLVALCECGEWDHAESFTGELTGAAAQLAQAIIGKKVAAHISRAHPISGADMRLELQQEVETA